MLTSSCLSAKVFLISSDILVCLFCVSIKKGIPGREEKVQSEYRAGITDINLDPTFPTRQYNMPTHYVKDLGNEFLPAVQVFLLLYP